ncbi:MAG: M1 family metallopeptidase [Rhodothermales bacterium]
MMRQLLSFLTSLLLVTAPAAAQDAESPFDPLDLPTPNHYRASTGEPGEAYWQQRADYRITATLNPIDKTIRGSETIEYTNNSPYELGHVWIQLDQNLFRPGSRGSEIQPPESRWRGSFEGGGYEIMNVNVAGRPAEFMISDTRMRIELADPLPPGEAGVEISMDFTFRIPQYGADRMGWLEVEKGTVFELAQWYPRMYVLDDVHGWNPMPYLGQGEFYLEYGDFDIEITVPRNFIVASTGSLQNPDAVLTALQRQRLDSARESEETVLIVSPDEVGTASARPSGSGPLTWKFRAENVRDVAWAASQAFIWDAAGWNDVLNMSYYPHEGLGTEDDPGWEESTEYVRHSIKHYSEMWYPYPYPVAINVAGIVGGMEYPMMVFCSVRARDRGLFGVTTHEIGHEWYPMIVGSDERRHAWMDEGFNTFINHYSTQAYYGEETPTRLTADYIAGLMQSEIADQPSYLEADRIRREGLGFLAYRKPGMGLYLLREYILPEGVFDRAFREYTVRWAYKHPQPADFFRTIEDVSGEDLDWFWRAWFMETGVIDQGVASVSGSEEQTEISISQQEGVLMPVELAIEYAGGETELRRIPVEAFFNSNTFTEIVAGGVESVTIDPRYLLPDVERSNNVWSASEPSIR